MKPLNVIFMGTPEFSVPALKSLHEAGHHIVAVYSQPPRPKGRGYEVTPSPVHVYAQEQGIPVLHPKSLKGIDEQNIFADLKPDVAVVAAYGLLLPKAVLGAPRFGCINIHASILPRWRGASPIQQSIWKGDAETGVTLMQMDVGLDTGSMIMTGKVKITPTTTATSLHDELSALGSKMIVDALAQLSLNGKLESKTQDEALVTYAPLLKKEDGQVNWNQTADEIDRQVRALNPWPGVWATLNGKRVKIFQASVSDKSAGTAGTIITKDGRVQCGGGTSTTIISIQPEGKKPMDFAAFINGGYGAVGGKFE